MYLIIFTPALDDRVGNFHRKLFFHLQGPNIYAHGRRSILPCACFHQFWWLSLPRYWQKAFACVSIHWGLHPSLVCQRDPLPIKKGMHCFVAALLRKMLLFIDWLKCPLYMPHFCFSGFLVERSDFAVADSHFIELGFTVSPFTDSHWEGN